MPQKPSYLNFNNAAYPWRSNINYREHPELYKVGKGEQGVLICEPYKSEIGKHWRFKDKAIAQESAETIFNLFNKYMEDEDFVGADMSRKYLQMGYTRARRYANYKGGKKYDKENNYHPLTKGTGETEKAEAAEIFHHYWKLAEQNTAYQDTKKQWRKSELAK